MTRRLLLVPVAVAAVAVPMAVAEGPSTKKAQARKASAAPGGRGPSAYARAREHGQPIAVLTRSSALLDAPGGRRLARIGPHTEWGGPTVLAALGERRGWLRVMATQLRNGRTGWITSRAARVLANPAWNVEADLSRRLVTVRSDGRVVRRFRVAVGRPATPTPTGRFAVTDKIHFTDHSRAYGWGAVALTGHQTHIEPGWTGGNRLAIHGTSDPASIGTAASFGCLRATDGDVRWLVRHAYLGAIVEIRP
jgi:lipoprotein-anchoring transpeptidase ErfK/SrfK